MSRVRSIVSQVLGRLGRLHARHKWIVWVLLALVLAVAFDIVVSHLPHHVIDAISQDEEKANGLHGPPPSSTPAGLLLSGLGQ